MEGLTMTDEKRIDDDQLNEIAGGATGLGTSDLADDPPQGDGGNAVGGSTGSGRGETNPGGVGPGDSTGGTGDGANQDLG
jgi:hypothetical protein